MSHKARQRDHARRRMKRRAAPGTAPGSLTIDPLAPRPVIRLLAYSPEKYIERDIADPEELRAYLGHWHVCWVDVEGLGDARTLEQIAAIFHLHPLAMEDVVNVHQRAKVDTFGERTFMVTHIFSVSDHLESEQVSLFLGRDFVITFQERPGDCLEIHDMKRELLYVRRAVWPQREALNMLVRDEIPHISAETRLYLRDCYDHCVRIIDLLETYREVCSDLMDLYLSSISNRMNEIMKVLTIISTLFIPLTFIVGIYGMNFDPQASPLNMPETKWYWGYPLCLALMAVITIGQLFFFRHKGWIGQGKPPPGSVEERG